MALRRKIRRRSLAQAPKVRRNAMAGQRAAPDGGLMVGGAQDPAERAADTLAARALSGGNAASQGGALRREEAEPGEDDKLKRDAALSPRVAPGTASAPAPKGAARAVADLGAGRPLSPAERGYFEPRFGVDFTSVRLHQGERANQATRALDARAFTHGTDIALGENARGTATLAHELAHVALEGPGTLRRDLAVDPSNPGALAATLTATERAAAQRFNERRFEDPFTIAIIRDVMGISKYPAVIDNDFIDALVGWQAEHDLQQDGQFGPATTRSFVAELTGEGMADLVRQLRGDNSVRVTDVNPPRFPTPTAGAAPGSWFFGFIWDVAFASSLRNGFIVQHVQNTWAENPAPGAPPPPTADYWEAWAVDGGGRVTPTGVTTENDQWRRVMHNNTAGNWTMAGTLYTVLNLPAQFAAQGAANHAPDSGILRSALNLSASSIDSLGLPEGFAAIQQGDERARRIGGEWDYTHANPALHFNRRR